MTAVYGFVNRLSVSESIASDGSRRTLSGEIPLGWMAVVAGITGAAAIAGGRYGKRKRTARDCLLAVTQGDASATLHGIYDSGNLLTDPISNRPVIVATEEALAPLLPDELRRALFAKDPTAITELSPNLARRIRLVPSHSVGGSALLPAFAPDTLTVDGVEKDALLAVSPTSLSCDAIVPEVLG